MRNTPRLTHALLALGLSIVLVGLSGRFSLEAGGSATTTVIKDILEDLNDEHVKELVKKTNEIAEKAQKTDEYLKQYEELSKEDSQFEPDFSRGGMPVVPALCKDSAECAQCFAKPHAQLDSVRFRFEKLRKVNRVTKDMLRDYIGFGDAMAEAAGGLAGIVWAKEKEKVRASEANFNSAYDTKLEELLATLKVALDGISACEEQVFGQQSWYERYGFIYYQFMADAYRRPD